MPEEPFKNREIMEMFQDVKKDLKDIKEQTTKHNGRMTRVERWQAYMTGAFSVITLIVLPILAWALYTLANINTTVHSAVDQALQAYNITNTTN